MTYVAGMALKAIALNFPPQRTKEAFTESFVADGDLQRCLTDCEIIILLESLGSGRACKIVQRGRHITPVAEGFCLPDHFDVF